MRGTSWRRRALLGIVAVAAWIGGAYLYATRPARLRAELRRAFAELKLSGVRFTDASFSLRDGLAVNDLELAAGDGSRPGAVAQRVPLLRVAQARVRCNRAALLRGRFQPRQITLRGAALSVVLAPASGADNLPARPARQPSAGPLLAGGWPALESRRVDVRLLLVDQGRLHLVDRLAVDVVGRPERRAPGGPGYRLVVRRAGTPTAAPLAELRLDQKGGWAATLDWLDLETLRALLPNALRARCVEFDLRGRLRLERLEARGGRLARAQLRFARLDGSIPLAAAGASLAPAERFLQVRGARGTVWLESPGARAADGRLELEAAGRVAGAPLRLELGADLSGALALPAAFGGPVGRDGPILPRVSRYRAALRAENLPLPDADQRPALVGSPRLPGALRSFLGKYAPRGRVNVELSLGAARAAGRGWRVQTRGQVEALGASCRYEEFPYRVADVRGRLRFADGSVYLEDLRGRHGNARVWASGRIYTTDPWTGFELTFDGRNVPFDRELYGALPRRFQRLCDDATPIGLFDARVTVRRRQGTPESGPDRPQVRVRARLLSGSLALADGRRLDHSDGLFTAEHGVLSIGDLHGYCGQARVRLGGTVDQRPPADDGRSAARRVRLHVEAVGVPLERVSAVPDRQGGSLGKLELQGSGNVWGELIRDGPGAPAGGHYAVHLRAGRLTSFDPALPWEQASGWLVLNGQRQRLRSLRAESDGAWLVAAGSLPAEMTLAAPLALDLTAGGPSIARLLRQVVPARWSRIREALGLGGAGKLSLRLRSRPRGAQPAELSADVQLEARQMKPEPLPLELHAVKARLTLRPDGLELHEASAACAAGGRIRVGGRAGWKAGSAWSDVQVTADGLEFSAELIDAMPPAFARLLRRLGPRGRLHARLDQVRMSGAAQRGWDIAGRLRFEHAALLVGLPLSEFDGELSGCCRVGPDGQVALEADFLIERGLLAARRIAGWEGALTKSADDPWLRLEDVRGQLCGGQVVGRGRLEPDSGAYQIALTLRDVSLERLLRPAPRRGAQPPRGRIDGRVFVQGRGGDASTRQGGGKLRIRGASFLHTPVLASLARAARDADRRVGDRLERIELRFVWSGSELRFTRLEIHSRDLRLVGTGRWDLADDALELTLLGARPEHWPRVAVLSELVEVAAQELLQYRVSGTAAAPRVQVEPLHNLTGPLRELLAGG